MASKRAPLASVPNAVNSPFRNIAAANGKRTRADAIHGQPPAKKQVIELSDDNDEENIDPRRRNGVPVAVRGKLDEPFLQRSAPRQPTALERKLAAAREKKPPIQTQNNTRTTKANDADGLENLRQWQRHYRKQFPSFVLYFDNVPDDVRHKTARQAQSLGAREEKFFSKSVTHVITTRPIPTELTNTNPDEDTKYDGSQQKTANAGVSGQEHRRTTNMLDAHLQRRTQAHTALTTIDVDIRKGQPHGSDILSRARQLGIKIWALEKLHRILHTIIEADAADRVGPPATRSQTVTVTTNTKPNKDVDLEQLLRNEKITGPADRDMTVASQDMCTFQGYYIYVHDVDEKMRPVMIRDYAKPSAKEEGKWPQFRVTGEGRCPFVDDPQHRKKIAQQQATRAQDEIAHTQRRTRASVNQQSHPATQPAVLAERQANLRRSPRKLDPTVDAQSKALEPPRVPSIRQPSTEGMPPLFGSAQQSLRGPPRMIGGEPVASGVQRSNVTSAIRSQYISSAAISSTAPGANHRVGDSKEVSALKRKLLERGTSFTSNQSMPSSYMNEMRAAINNDRDPPPRAAKRKAQETLGVLHEDDECGKEQRPAKQSRQVPKRRKPVARDPKPGYCENCRDKFDDFDEHIQSRKHRKFALTQDNWKELDQLLALLKRPHKRVPTN